MAVQQRRHALDPDWLLNQLREMYGYRVSDWDLRHVWAPSVCVGKGIYMTREFQDHAEQIIVHSATSGHPAAWRRLTRPRARRSSRSGPRCPRLRPGSRESGTTGR